MNTSANDGLQVKPNRMEHANLCAFIHAQLVYKCSQVANSYEENKTSVGNNCEVALLQSKPFLSAGFCAATRRACIHGGFVAGTNNRLFMLAPVT